MKRGNSLRYECLNLKNSGYGLVGMLRPADGGDSEVTSQTALYGDKMKQ